MKSEQIEDDRFFIKTVREQPCLYDKSHRFYTNAYMRNDIWEDMAEALQVTSFILKRRWNNLRKRFSWERRKLQSTGEPCKPWPLYEDMLFLQDTAAFRNNTREANGQFQNDVQESELSLSAAKEEDICQLSGSEIEEEAQNLVKRVMDYVDLNEERNTLENIKPNALNTSTTDNNSRSITKQHNNSIDAVDESIMQRINNIDEKLSSLPVAVAANDVFVKTILSLMKDLPLSVKEQFQANLYDEIYRLRSEFID